MIEKRRHDFPLVSIVISNYNSRETLGACLSSLMNLTFPNCEIIVVDAASSDGSAEFVENEFPQIELIRAERIGIGEAINIGIKASKGELVVVDFNSDEVATPQWLNNLYAVLKNWPQVVAVGGIRLRYGSGNIIDSAGGKIHFFGHQSKIGEGREYEEYPKKPHEVDYLGCMLIERKTIERVGPFDEAFLIYGEDADYCIRIREAGYRVVCVPEAITYHRVSHSIGEHAIKQRYFLRRAETRLMLKHGRVLEILPTLSWATVLISADALMCIPLFRMLVKNTKFSHLYEGNMRESFRMSVRALLWNLKNLSATFKARKEFSPSRY